MEESLYEYILKNASPEGLPDDFSLPPFDDGTEGRARFADGARDGTYIYHVRHTDLSWSEKNLMAGAVKAASEGNEKLADDLFMELGRQVRAVRAVDSLQEYIEENAGELNEENILRYALYLISESADRECVKFGLEILELYDIEDDPDITRLVYTVGLSDEFTAYAAFNMRYWHNGNRYIFGLAKKVHGWGRIHCVEILEPKTREIRDWLLYSGYKNDIDEGYTAATCLEKCGTEERLSRGLTEKEFHGLERLLYYAVRGGPAISILDDEKGAEIVEKWLDAAAGFKLFWSDYSFIDRICQQSDKDSARHESIRNKCRNLLKKRQK